MKISLNDETKAMFDELNENIKVLNATMKEATRVAVEQLDYYQKLMEKFNNG